MKLWHRTNIDIRDCYLPGLDMKEYLLSENTMQKHNTFFVDGSGGIWNIPAVEIFNEKFLKYMHGITKHPISIVNCFMRWPNYQHPTAHYDCYEYEGEVIQHGGGLNWCWEPDNADMVWYKPSADADIVTEKRRNIEMNVSVDIDDTLIELDRCNVGQTPTLVNTSEFHSVEMNDRMRIVLSLRFEWVVPWDQHLEVFKDYIID